MEFEYTIDPNADEPIMLIDKHIGMDEEDGEGIIGSKFSKELLFLDTLNKSRIHVWINSPGGSVLDGLQIIGTILKTKTKVDTHNLGVAASIAFPIWLSGRSRYMMDYSKGMVHPVHGGSDEKTSVALEDSVLTSISNRSGIDTSVMKDLMARTTWLSSQDCGPEGFNICKVESSQAFNKPRASNDWKDFKVVMNKLIDAKKPKIKYMKDVANKLKLNSEASEQAIVNEIEKLQNNINVSNDALNKAKADLDEAENKFNELKNKYDKMTNDMNALNEANKVANKAAIEVKAKAEVANLVKIGKIGNDADVIKNWENKFVEDFDGTKKLTDSLTITKNGADLKKDGVKDGNAGISDEKKLTMVAANAMHEIRNKLKLQA